MSLENSKLQQFGFDLDRAGVHTARTIMLDELTMLLSWLQDEGTSQERFRLAIEEENCLAKRSVKSRSLTYRHLSDLYLLDPNLCLFRALRFFWNRDPEGRPLLALFCAISRDKLLREATPFVLGFTQGQAVTREALEHFIESREPDRFSNATLKSTAQNLNSSWTKSGHLSGRNKKVRSQARATAGSVAYALLISYLEGKRGHRMFASEPLKLLDCSRDRAIELAEDASRKGWLVFKRVGDVIEVLFPGLIKPEEMEWLREQN